MHILLAAILTVGCGAGGGSGDNEKNVERMRFVHADPRTDVVEVELQSETILPDFSYGDATDYLSVPEGDLRIRLYEPDHSLPMIDATQQIASGKSYTLFLVDESESPVLFLREDDNERPVEDEDMKLRVTNVAENVSTVDLYVADPDGDFPQEPAIENVAWKASSAFLSMRAGTYKIGITRSGRRTILGSRTIHIPAQNVVDIVVIRKSGSSSQVTPLLLETPGT